MEMKEFVAKTFHGLEGVLAKELQELGAENIVELSRGVQFNADQKTLYTILMSARTALKILTPLTSFDIKSIDELYRMACRINWDEYIALDGTFAVESVTSGTIAKHSQYAGLLIKDAIADTFMKRYDKRPNVDKHEPEYKIHLHINQEKVTISFDLSGVPLNRRGYRRQLHDAPLNEVLAAGVVLLSGWDKKTPLIDLFCGSGTILTEAALLASNTAPNVYRKKFGIMNLPGFDKKVWQDIKMDLIDEIVDIEADIIGVDIDGRYIRMAEVNNREAGFDYHQIKLVKADMADYHHDYKSGVIITNPPYGERLNPNMIAGLYRKLGRKLKLDFKGFSAYVFSASEEGFRMIGLKPTEKYDLYNGPLEAWLKKFDMYEGSKKDKSNYSSDRSFEKKSGDRNNRSDRDYRERPDNRRGNFNRDDSGRRNSSDRGYNRDHSDRRNSSDRGYNRDHSDRRNSSDRGYNRDHSDRRNSFDRGYNRDHSDRRNSSDRGYNRDHSDRRNSSDRGYNRDHSDRRNSPDRGYNRDHSDRRNSSDRGYRRDRDDSQSRGSFRKGFDTDRKNRREFDDRRGGRNANQNDNAANDSDQNENAGKKKHPSIFGNPDNIRTERRGAFTTKNKDRYNKD